MNNDNLIIEGNSVYEIDEECLKIKNNKNLKESGKPNNNAANEEKKTAQNRIF